MANTAKYSIGVDIGGTNIAFGIVDESGKILLKKSIKTESELGYNAVLDNISNTIKEMVGEMNAPDFSESAIRGIGVGCPGICNKGTGVIERAVNLNWYNVPLCADLKRATEYDVILDNDANAAAYGEFAAGAAKGTNSAIVITLGTGVGAGIIIDKKLLYGMNFAGGEIGHMAINAEGVKCNCGRIGCFEAYSSATGLIRMTAEAIEQNPDSEMRLLTEQKGKVSARTAWRAAESGDVCGKAVVEKYIYYLACGITNVINIFQPDIVCIGGGVCNEGDNLLVPLRKAVSEQVFSRESKKNSEIAVCMLGNDAGIIGAAMLV